MSGIFFIKPPTMFRILSLSITILSFTSVVFCQTIGYVNSGEILSDMPEVIDIQGTIDSMQTISLNQIEKMSTELTQEYNRIQTLESKGEISPKEVAVEVEKLRVKRQSILDFEKESQQKLLILQDSLFSPVRDQFEQMLKLVAKENNLNFIVEDAPGFFWYKDEAMDVSSQIRAKLGVR